MTGGGGGLRVDTKANRLFQFLLGIGRVFFQTKFSAVGSSLGHLSMKKFFRSKLCLGPKIRQREGAGGGGGW